LGRVEEKRERGQEFKVLLVWIFLFCREKVKFQTERDESPGNKGADKMATLS